MLQNNLKIATIHDWFTDMGGAEKVVEVIQEIYPSPIYTLAYYPEGIARSSLKEENIQASFIQKLPFSPKKYRTYLPLFPLAIEQFNLSAYDVVLSSSSAAAKGANTHSQQLHICYCHSPIRYAWDLYHQYLHEAGLTKGLKGWIAKLILHYIRMWDISTINRVDHFIANSHYIARRIKKIYNREATVIYPPVNTGHFELCEQKQDFYLAASRFVPYKKMDLIVEAFAQMPDKKLVVIGSGPDEKKVLAKAKGKSNIEFLGYQPFAVLKEYMQKAKAFVFAAEEDFGITPVEAQACGTPVIAYGKGGALETVVADKTGLFFKQQTTASLIEAVAAFESRPVPFIYADIKNHAEKISKERFKREYKAFVESKCELFFNTKC